MSIPRNHHYVSQFLSRKFRDANGNIYLYDKQNKVFSSTASTKRLFSERDLNSVLTDEGEIDHGSVENSLNKNFETDFNTHYDKVIAALYNPHNFDNSEEWDQSLKYLIGMGIIGEMRNPNHKTIVQQAILEPLRIIAQYAKPELKADIEAHDQRLDGIKNKIPIDYKEISAKTFELMGEVRYIIYIAPENEFFLLPDICSLVFRSQLEDDIVIGGEIYRNFSRPISTITMPINSKTLLFAQAAKVNGQKTTGIFRLTSERVFQQNQHFFQRSYKEIACSNEVYLKHFIEKMESNV